jgi:glycosyltransferase involved in cell wall biosynthesis
VTDIASAYREADIAINPVTFGGGLKIKTVEALAFAKPLVTTPVGACGLEDGANRAFVVCTAPHEISKALIRLVAKPAERHALARAAHDYATRKFNEEAAYGELDRWLSEQIAGRANRREGGEAAARGPSVARTRANEY